MTTRTTMDIINDANLKLEKIMEDNFDTVYCNAYYYGQEKMIHLDGHFPIDAIIEIGRIAEGLKSNE